jgi:hypothetical protein
VLALHEYEVLRGEEFVGFVMVGDSSNRSSRVEVRSFEIPIGNDDNNKRSVGIKLQAS